MDIFFICSEYRAGGREPGEDELCSEEKNETQSMAEYVNENEGNRCNASDLEKSYRYDDGMIWTCAEEGITQRMLNMELPGSRKRGKPTRRFVNVG